jgi:hypothetical protein
MLAPACRRLWVHAIAASAPHRFAAAPHRRRCFASIAAHSTAAAAAKQQSTASMEVVRLPALDDNYIWLLHEPRAGKTAVVDPAETGPVLKALQERCVCVRLSMCARVFRRGASKFNNCQACTQPRKTSNNKPPPSPKPPFPQRLVARHRLEHAPPRRPHRRQPRAEGALPGPHHRRAARGRKAHSRDRRASG